MFNQSHFAGSVVRVHEQAVQWSTRRSVRGDVAAGRFSATPTYLWPATPHPFSSTYTTLSKMCAARKTATRALLLLALTVAATRAAPVSEFDAAASDVTWTPW